MMRQMRQNTKIIMLVTAAAFVALMVFEWGMDMSGQTAGGDMGRVGSTSVSVQEFNTVRQSIYEQVQQTQESAITSQQEREIDDQAWDQVVNQILIEKELRNRGIRVTDDEIRQAALYDPHPALRNDPQFRTEDGQFNLQAYHDWLRQVAQVDPQVMQTIEAYYRETLPRNKLVRQLTAGIHVSESELWREFRDRNEQVSVRFLSLRPTDRISESDVEVTDAEIESWYQENREDFRVPATADVRYVRLV
ncbi:MAG: hypothetical protein EA352_10925, partial [Gemmatimonadales bacterium]